MDEREVRALYPGRRRAANEPLAAQAAKVNEARLKVLEKVLQYAPAEVKMSVRERARLFQGLTGGR
jgi:hypothetical protein